MGNWETGNEGWTEALNERVAEEGRGGINRQKVRPEWSSTAARALKSAAAAGSPSVCLRAHLSVGRARAELALRRSAHVESIS